MAEASPGRLPDPVPPIPGIEDGTVADLLALAAYLEGHLAASRRDHVADGAWFDSRAWAVLEAAGELAGAHSRWRGTARRAGTRHGVADEVADLILAAAVYGVTAGAARAAITDSLRTGLGGPLLAITSADEALLEIGRGAGLLAQMHASLPGSGWSVTGHVAGMIHLARLYAAHADIDVHAAVASKASQILSAAPVESR